MQSWLMLSAAFFDYISKVPCATDYCLHITSYCNHSVYVQWMWHGATDSTKDYGARGPRFDPQQWIISLRKWLFSGKTTSPYFLLSFCNSFHYKKYLCNLRNWIKIIMWSGMVLPKMIKFSGFLYINKLIYVGFIHID